MTPAIRVFPPRRLSSPLRQIAKLSIAMAAVFYGGCTGAFQLHGAALGMVQVDTQQAHHSEATASAQLQLEFFDISLEGAQDIVFVLDRSGSMSLATVGASGEEMGMTRGQAVGAEVGMALANAASGGVLPTRMEAAKQELADALQRLPQGTRFNVVFFNEELHALSPTMMVMGPHTRSAAVHFVQSTDADGGTASACGDCHAGVGVEMDYAWISAPGETWCSGEGYERRWNCFEEHARTQTVAEGQGCRSDFYHRHGEPCFMEEARLQILGWAADGYPE